MKPDYLASPTLWTLTIVCFLLTLILTLPIMNLARRIGAVDRGGHRRVHNGSPMPLLGGLAIALPFIAVCLLGLMHPSNMFGVIGNHRPGLLALALGGLGIGLLGALDDAFGLRARTKFAGQVCLATLTCFAGYTIRAIDLPFYGHLPLGEFMGTALTLLWIVGLTNAYNLIDGIDGLAAGLALIAAVGLAIISMLNGATFPALMCLALCGSLLAFLIYNFHPARIFLGDTGSMFLGYALANIALMGSLKTTGAVIFIAPILVLGLPIMDTLISMLRRYLHGQPLFTGDQGAPPSPAAEEGIFTASGGSDLLRDRRDNDRLGRGGLGAAGGLGPRLAGVCQLRPRGHRHRLDRRAGAAGPDGNDKLPRTQYASQRALALRQHAPEPAVEHLRAEHSEYPTVHLPGVATAFPDVGIRRWKADSGVQQRWGAFSRRSRRLRGADEGMHCQ